MCWEISGFLPSLLGDPKIPTRIFQRWQRGFFLKENMYILIFNIKEKMGYIQQGQTYLIQKNYKLIDPKNYTTRFDEILHSCMDRFPLIL